jgi:hypothetical protein
MSDTRNEAYHERAANGNPRIVVLIKNFHFGLIKLLPESPGSIFIDQVVAHMAELGRVNHATSPS